ncbi:MAG: hypothetical protein R8N23_07190 [Reichenbachiella sp.]|uniref:hypothetical protein n=1 Tax=Reichenbachiella sp. TaxID=2184521 RepID=UPI00296755CD|nr:hypothetical protein [Reichenbachiella sp.]MDW3209632.1 hypothetical protein [Reichenbachiella sp.]
MRLGTLARKISITPSKLTSFLESQNIGLSSGTNTKLSEEEIELVLAHYDASLEEDKPEPEEEPIAESEEEEAPVVEEETQEEEVISKVKDTEAELTDTEEGTEKVVTKEEESEPKVSESFAEIALPHELEEDSLEIEAAEPEQSEIENSQETRSEKEELEEKEEEYVPQVPDDLDPEIESYVERLAYDENIEVIKPVKVKLQGLTVKGKIDLPEPKVEAEIIEEPKKEEKKTFDPDEIITTTGPRRDRKRKPKNYKGKKFNKDYNPLEAARKKKEWEEKKRKEQEERRKKKAKEQHYKKVAKPVAAAPSTKKKPKKVKAKKKQVQQQPTGNMLQRFWRWMNT